MPYTVIYIVGGDKPPTVRGQLEQIIDAALGQGCKDFDGFLAAMKVAGVEIKRGKHLAFKIPNGKRFVHCNSLGADYSETAIMERISGKRIVAPRTKAAVNSKPNLLIDIQAKMAEGKGKGYERWAKTFNLKEMAKTLIYLQEDELTDLGELEKACDAAVQKFNDLSDQSKAASARMKNISELQKHIGSYGKTREIFAQYRKLTGRKREKFYEQHSSEITVCQAAKRVAWGKEGQRNGANARCQAGVVEWSLSRRADAGGGLKIRAHLRPDLQGLGGGQPPTSTRRVYTGALLAVSATTNFFHRYENQYFE